MYLFGGEFERLLINNLMTPSRDPEQGKILRFKGQDLVARIWKPGSGSQHLVASIWLPGSGNQDVVDRIW